MESKIAVEIWNLMGGEISWDAIPMFMDVFEIKDAELLIYQLAEIRNFLNATKGS